MFSDSSTIERTGGEERPRAAGAHDSAREARCSPGGVDNGADAAALLAALHRSGISNNQTIDTRTLKSKCDCIPVQQQKKSAQAVQLW